LEDKYNLLSICVDGVSSDAEFMRKQMSLFMTGSSNVVPLIDPNHVLKALRGQALYKGDSVLTLGNAVFDVGLLRAAGIDLNLIRVSDYASDVLVQKLASAKTVYRVSDLDGENPNDSTLVCFYLFFMRCIYWAINAGKTACVNRSFRAKMIWCSMIFMDSLEGLSSTTLRNLYLSSVGLVMLLMNEAVDPNKLVLVTEEPCEHYFGCMRSFKREFMVSEFLIYCDKLRRFLDAKTRSNLSSGNERMKGYLAGFEEFFRKINSANDKKRKVNAEYKDPFPGVNADFPAISSLECVFRDSVSDSCRRMTQFFKGLNWKSSSTLLKPFRNLNDIINRFDKYMPKTYSSKDSKLSAPLSIDELVAVGVERMLERLNKEDGAQGTQVNLEDFDMFISEEDFDSLLNEPNIDKLLEMMKKIEKVKSSGSADEATKFNSLKNRYFSGRLLTLNNQELCPIDRKTYFEFSNCYYRVLWVFAMHYKKWMIHPEPTSAYSDEHIIVASKIRLNLVLGTMEDDRDGVDWLLTIKANLIDKTKVGQLN
jgi:hypothetical protein